MGKQLLHIGTVELVSLPDYLSEHVPAKIDTGADGSAMWASNIRQTAEGLSFSLFAPGSAYFRNDTVTVTDFKTVKVRNSFGHQERRYKVKLTLEVGSHQVTDWFSLADRSANTYPILLGKNFLNKRFIVDVSRQYVVSHDILSHQILVVDRSPKLTQTFFDEVKQHNKQPLSYTSVGYKDLLFYFDGVASQIFHSGDRERDVAQYTLTYFKSHAGNTEFAAAAAEYLKFKARPFIDSELGEYISDSKLTETARLACYDLPVPRTWCAKTSLLSKQYERLEESLGLPFVLKEIWSDRGKNNYLITSRQQFQKILRQAPETYTFMAQAYVDHTFLARVFVTGKTATVAIRKERSSKNDHITRFSSTGKTQPLTLNPTLANLAQQAAACLGRQVAGVDLVKDSKTGKWYILEVNSSPQLRSGSDVATKAVMIAKFFDKEVSK